MSIHVLPQYRYSLFESWDKEAFQLIKKIAHDKAYPKILGAKDDKNQYLITLIRTQKSLHGWREFLEKTLDQVKKTGEIDTVFLNKEYPPESIAKDTPKWVTYPEDTIVSEFIDELEERKIDFVGSDPDMAEFILRFILGQLGHDWESTIMMIWEMLGEDDKISVTDLNQEMKNFDYLKLFV